MRERHLPILLGAACVGALVAATSAQAAFVPWTYKWDTNVPFVSSTNGQGRIYLSDGPLSPAVGSSDVVVTNLRTASTSALGVFDKFDHAPFSVSITITDTNSGKVGSLTWNGYFQGDITSGSANVWDVWTSPIVQSLKLGQDTFKVSIGRYSPPGPPGISNSGSISGHVDAISPHDPAHAPEPSGALLACLGGSCLSLASWRKWRQARGQRSDRSVSA
jgi:hypothetical protein